MLSNAGKTISQKKGDLGPPALPPSWSCSFSLSSARDSLVSRPTGYDRRRLQAPLHIPLYHWQSIDELRLPRGCRLVGIELLDEALELPAFAHPVQAAYVLVPERGVLSKEVLARCHHLVRIPTAFSLDLATAGAIVMYDRLRCLGRFATRPVAEGGAPEPRTENVQGGLRRRRRQV